MTPGRHLHVILTLLSLVITSQSDTIPYELSKVCLVKERSLRKQQPTTCVTLNLLLTQQLVHCFTDPMTAGTAWTITAGGFTFSGTGATSTINSSYITAGNLNCFRPLIGSGGQNLALTVQVTFKTPPAVPSSMEFDLVGSAWGNRYTVIWQNDNNLVLYKAVNSVSTPLASTAVTTGNYTQVANTTYTITLQYDYYGNSTVKLYSGVGVGGTLLKTFSGTQDTSVAGPYSLYIGGNQSVIVSNVYVFGALPDSWALGNDTSTNPGIFYLNPTTYSNAPYGATLYRASNAVGTNNSYVYSSNYTALPNTTYTYSAYVNASSLGSGSFISLRTIEYNGAMSVVRDLSTTVISAATNGFVRVSTTINTQATTANLQLRLVLTGSGTVTFGSVQWEAKAYSTTYTRNDSTTGEITHSADSLYYNLSQPLPSRYFGALWWTPAYASTTVTTHDRIFMKIINPSATSSPSRYALRYFTTGVFGFRKLDTVGTTYDCNSTAISFNGNDRIFIAWLDDPTTGYMYLWVGINGGTLQRFTLANKVTLTDAKTVYLCNDLAGHESNGIIDYPILSSTLPTPDQVNALYLAPDWGGIRNYPNNTAYLGINNQSVNKVIAAELNTDTRTTYLY